MLTTKQKSYEEEHTIFLMTYLGVFVCQLYKKSTKMIASFELSTFVRYIYK